MEKKVEWKCDSCFPCKAEKYSGLDGRRGVVRPAAFTVPSWDPVSPPLFPFHPPALRGGASLSKTFSKDP